MARVTIDGVLVPMRTATRKPPHCNHKHFGVRPCGVLAIWQVSIPADDDTHIVIYACDKHLGAVCAIDKVSQVQYLGGGE